MAQTKLTDLPEVLVADNAMEVLVDDAGTVKKITRAKSTMPVLSRKSQERILSMD